MNVTGKILRTASIIRFVHIQFKISTKTYQGTGVQACNPTTWGTEVGRAQCVPGHPELRGVTLSQNKENINCEKQLECYMP